MSLTNGLITPAEFQLLSNVLNVLGPGTLAPGVVSGLISGAGNSGTIVSGLFNLGPK
jgi:hypothetical protein